MPQSPTTSPSVIYRWKYRRNKSIGKVLMGIFFWRASPVYKIVCVWVFFPDQSSDGNENYRRSIFRQTNFIGEAVDTNITNKVCVLHRRNESVNKTV
jgi:hypothetical protein